MRLMIFCGRSLTYKMGQYYTNMTTCFLLIRCVFVFPLTLICPLTSIVGSHACCTTAAQVFHKMPTIRDPAPDVACTDYKHVLCLDP